MENRTIRIILLLVCIVLTASGCTGLSNNGIGKQVEASEMIIPLSVDDILKRPADEVIAYFQERRAELVSLSEYMLANERIFQARPVILHQDSAIELIQDPDIQEFAYRLFEEGVVTMISSLNDDPNKRVDMWIDQEHGVFLQGIAYVSQPDEVLDRTPSRLNFVENYTDLGGGWYYYVNHYDKILEEDLYRELAWGTLSVQERDTLTVTKEQAIVALESGTHVSRWAEDRGLEIVVSVEFNTELDGLLGPIKLYFDPATKELLGGNPRL